MNYCIDMGHNAKFDSGATGYKQEDTLTKEVGLILRDKLVAGGHTVRFANPVNPQAVTGLLDSLKQRVHNANAWPADIYVAIHFNCGGGHGSEVYAVGPGGNAEQLAKKVQNELVALGYYNRGVKFANFYVIKYTNMPAILVECSFVDSKSDMDKYNAEEIAGAICKGLIGSNPSSKPATPPPVALKLGKVTASALNVRTGPGTNYPLAGAPLVRGTQVKISTKVGNFLNIYYGEHGGWVSADYIQLI